MTPGLENADRACICIDDASQVFCRPVSRIRIASKMNDLIVIIKRYVIFVEIATADDFSFKRDCRRHEIADFMINR